MVASWRCCLLSLLRLLLLLLLLLPLLLLLLLPAAVAAAAAAAVCWLVSATGAGGFVGVALRRALRSPICLLFLVFLLSAPQTQAYALFILLLGGAITCLVSVASLTSR